MSLTPERLKRLVVYRERLEHLQERKLGDAQRAHAAREQTLAETGQRREALFAAGAPGSGPVAPEDLALGRAYVERLDREATATRAALVHSNNAVVFERNQLLVRRRDRKSLETLLEQRVKEERIRERRADLATLDGMALRDWVPDRER